MSDYFYSLHMLLWYVSWGDPCAEIRMLQRLEDIANEENQ